MPRKTRWKRKFTENVDLIQVRRKDERGYENNKKGSCNNTRAIVSKPCKTAWISNKTRGENGKAERRQEEDKMT